jgi:CRP-like cAMP-binding protein
MKELQDHIAQIVSLTDDEFRVALSYFQVRTFRKHQIVIHEGDYVHHDYFVVKGLMRSSHTDPDGKEHIIQFAQESSWITDPQAFHQQTTATLNVDCLEDTRVLAISLSAREELCRELPKLEYFFNKKTTEGYIDLQKRILCLISSTASKRYHNLIARYPGLIQRISKTMIASYLGVTRETLSRLASVEA